MKMTLAQAVDAAFSEPSMASTADEYARRPSDGNLEALTGWIMSATDYRYERAGVRGAIKDRAVRAGKTDDTDPTPNGTNDDSKPSAAGADTPSGAGHLRVVQIKTNRDRNTELCVAKIEDLLARAKQGEFAHVMLIAMGTDGTTPRFLWTALAGREVASLGAVAVLKKVILDTLVFT